MEKVAKLLMVWTNEKQLAADSISEAMVCEKARELQDPSTRTAGDDFKARGGWFGKFYKRSGIHNVIGHSEASRSNKAAVEAYKNEYMELMKIEECITQQVFSCDGERLFWKKMLIRAHITHGEKALPGRT